MIVSTEKKKKNDGARLKSPAKINFGAPGFPAAGPPGFPAAGPPGLAEEEGSLALLRVRT